MKAVRIFHQKAMYKSTGKDGDFKVLIIKEIYKVPPANAAKFPDGFKVSMIAFRDDLPAQQVLLDCHPPKGPHYHLGLEETSFHWQGLEHANDLFWSLVETEFGPLEEVL